MPRASYQYGTSPRKYEPEYAPRTSQRSVKKSSSNKAKTEKGTIKSDAKKRIEKQKAKSKTMKVIVVIAIFGMLLALSYREIAIMEMFNKKKGLENQLSSIQKENGQIEKSIKQEESKLNWNEIKKTASEQMGMQIKTAIPVDLEKTDNVETTTKFIKEEKTNIIEEIVSYFINK